MELVNIPISSKLCYVSVETIWKNAGDCKWKDNIMNLKEIGVFVMNRLDQSK
jgi:hypothetical protein